MVPARRRRVAALALAAAGPPLAAAAAAVVFAAYGPYAAGPYGLGLVTPAAVRPRASGAAVEHQLRGAGAAWSWRLAPAGPAPAGSVPPGAVVEAGRFDWDGDGVSDTDLERVAGGWRVRRLAAGPPPGRPARVERYRDAAAVVAGRPAAVLAETVGGGRAAWVFFSPAGALLRVEYLASGGVVERVWFDAGGAAACRQVPAGRPGPPSAWPDQPAGAPADWRSLPLAGRAPAEAGDAC